MAGILDRRVATYCTQVSERYNAQGVAAELINPGPEPNAVIRLLPPAKWVLCHANAQFFLQVRPRTRQELRLPGKGDSMKDHEKRTQYRWKIRERMAILEQVRVYGIRPTAQ